jgi:hypothetical protein
MTHPTPTHDQNDPQDDGATPLARTSARTTIERARTRRVMSSRPYVAVALIFAGVFAIGFELVRYWSSGAQHYDISGMVVAIGSGFGFVGFYMLDRSDAKDAGQFLVSSTVSVIGAIRGGRRATDPPVVVAAPASRTRKAPIETDTGEVP